MFFDEPKADRRYQQLLLAMAHKQRQLLEYKFDWQNRQIRQWPPKGFFGKDKKAIACYEQDVRELEQLKAMTAAHCRQQGYHRGCFWWTIPWDQLETWLICDLYEPKEAGPWRWARSWELDRQGESCILLLKEEGHCSNFSGRRGYEYEELSKYSKSEQEDMVRDYNKKLDNYEAMQLLFDNDCLVRSSYGTVFASRADYMFSADHYLERWDLEESYRRSLYTEHHTDTLTVQSHSIHYECLLAVAEFHSRQDYVDGISLLDFAMVAHTGRVPEDLESDYAEKDAAVALAGFLADRPEFRRIPVEMLGRDITDGAASYAEAMRQAEFYTCLAGKLIFVD